MPATPLTDALRKEMLELRARLTQADSAIAYLSELITEQTPFKCSQCGEVDAEMSAYCSRKVCPKEHGPYNTMVWIK